MWEVLSLRPQGLRSLWNLLACVGASVVATIAVVFLMAPSASAQEWRGADISYNNETYNGPRTITADDRAQGLQIPEGAVYYSFYSPGATQPGPQTAKFIYFTPGTDPPAATSASYVTYQSTGIDTGFSSPSTVAALTLTPQPTTGSSANATSCDIDGVGWLVCPVAGWMAKGTDWVFDVLTGFMNVRPFDLSGDSVMYRSWSIMRNIANVAFVIAFMIIIYSQLTNAGLSSYGIKKLLPRLIMAAILVNISYVICALAVDASNILGKSLQDIFVSMRETLVPAGQANPLQATTWESMTSFILSGGTIVAAGTIATVAALGSVGSVTGLIFLLLPALVTVLVAVLVAFAILAARQAIITVLTVIAPLAFVAFLLPNTEKWFKKWRDLFMNMLLLFPVFSVLFGGSQLAAFLIMQNANDINTVLLGMFVQLIPLAITPFLLKFGANFLTRFAGFINNPNKGFVDRTRKFSQERVDQRRARAIAGGRGPLAGFARRNEMRKRKREMERKVYDTATDARWHENKDYANLHTAMKNAEQAKEIAEANVEAAHYRHMRSDASAQLREFNARAAKVNVDVSKAAIEADWKEFQAGDTRHVVTPDGLSRAALTNYVLDRQNEAQAVKAQAMQADIERRRASNADLVAGHNIMAQYQDSETLQREAGGIFEHGATSVLASAVAAERKAYNDRVQDSDQILRHFNLDSEQLKQFAFGRQPITYTDRAGNTKTVDTDSTYMREAAIESVMRGAAGFGAVQEMIALSGSAGLKEFRTTIGDAIVSNKLGDKAAYVGSVTINDVNQGRIQDNADLDVATVRSIALGEIGREQLVGMHPRALERIQSVLTEYYENRAEYVKKYVDGKKTVIDENGQSVEVDTGIKLSADQIALFETKVRELGATAAIIKENPDLLARIKPNSDKPIKEIIRMVNPNDEERISAGGKRAAAEQPAGTDDAEGLTQQQQGS